MTWTLDDVVSHVRAAMAPATSLAEARARYAQLTEVSDPPSTVTFTDEIIAGTPGIWATPPDRTPQLIVIHCHGGGFAAGSARAHRNLGGHLSLAIGAAVHLVDYDRSPEAVFPRQRDQVIATLDAITDDDVAVVLGGDSGAGLIFQVVCELRATDRPLPAALYGVGPMVDFEMSGASYSRIGNDPWSTTPEAHRWLIDSYLGTTPADDPRANVLHADLSGLPPTLIQVADDEFLRNDAKRLAQRLTQDGVDVMLLSTAGVVHDWPLFAPHFPPATEAIEQIGDFARRHAARGRTP